MKFRQFVAAAGAAAMTLSVSLAQAQAYPNKTIRVLLPFSAGSGPDAVVRDVGERMGAANKGQLIVDNRPGANGWIAADVAKRSPPDGYTFLLVDNAQMALQQHLYKKVPFNATKDFEPATPLYTTHFFIVVPASSKWKNVGDLIADAKAKPGSVQYGTWGIGSVAHVGTAMFEAATGTQMSHVPFKEIPTLYTSVSTGDVSWAFGSAASVSALYKAGKVKLLAVAAPKRLEGYPDIPTVAEAGGPKDFVLKTWVALVAPAGTPKTAIDYINAAASQALAEPGLKQKFVSFGFDPWIGKPADISHAIEQDSLTFSKVVKNAHISLD